MLLENLRWIRQFTAKAGVVAAESSAPAVARFTRSRRLSPQPRIRTAVDSSQWQAVSGPYLQSTLHNPWHSVHRKALSSVLSSKREYRRYYGSDIETETAKNTLEKGILFQPRISDDGVYSARPWSVSPIPGIPPAEPPPLKNDEPPLFKHHYQSTERLDSAAAAPHISSYASPSPTPKTSLAESAFPVEISPPNTPLLNILTNNRQHPEASSSSVFEPLNAQGITAMLIKAIVLGCGAVGLSFFKRSLTPNIEVAEAVPEFEKLDRKTDKERREEDLVRINLVLSSYSDFSTASIGGRSVYGDIEDIREFMLECLSSIQTRSGNHLGPSSLAAHVEDIIARHPLPGTSDEQQHILSPIPSLLANFEMPPTKSTEDCTSIGGQSQPHIKPDRWTILAVLSLIDEKGLLNNCTRRSAIKGSSKEDASVSAKPLLALWAWKAYVGILKDGPEKDDHEIIGFFLGFLQDHETGNSRAIDVKKEILEGIAKIMLDNTHLRVPLSNLPTSLYSTLGECAITLENGSILSHLLESSFSLMVSNAAFSADAPSTPTEMPLCEARPVLPPLQRLLLSIQALKAVARDEEFRTASNPTRVLAERFDEALREVVGLPLQLDDVILSTSRAGSVDGGCRRKLNAILDDVFQFEFPCEKDFPADGVHHALKLLMDGFRSLSVLHDLVADVVVVVLRSSRLSSPPFSAAFILSILNYLVDSKRSKEALAVLNATPEEFLTIAHYNVLLRSRNAVISQIVWDRLKTPGTSVHLNSSSFEARLLSHAHPENNDVEKAHEDLFTMQVRNIRRTISVWNKLLQIVARVSSEKALYRQWHLFLKDIDDSNGALVPNEETFRVLLQSEHDAGTDPRSLAERVKEKQDCEVYEYEPWPEYGMKVHGYRQPQWTQRSVAKPVNGANGKGTRRFLKKGLNQIRSVQAFIDIIDGGKAEGKEDKIILKEMVHFLQHKSKHRNEAVASFNGLPPPKQGTDRIVMRNFKAHPSSIDDGKRQNILLQCAVRWTVEVKIHHLLKITNMVLSIDLLDSKYTGRREFSSPLLSSTSSHEAETDLRWEEAEMKKVKANFNGYRKATYKILMEAFDRRGSSEYRGKLLQAMGLEKNEIWKREQALLGRLLVHDNGSDYGA